MAQDMLLEGFQSASEVICKSCNIKLSSNKKKENTHLKRWIYLNLTELYFCEKLLNICIIIIKININLTL